MITTILETIPYAATMRVSEPRHHQRSHRQWHKDLRSVLKRCSDEVLRCDTDNRQSVAVHHHAVIEHRRIAFEAGSPVRIAQDNDGMCARRAVVLGTQQSPECRPEREHWEVASGHEMPLLARRLAAVRNVGDEITVCGDSREHSLIAFDVAKQRVAEHRVGTKGATGRRTACLGTGR